MKYSGNLRKCLPPLLSSRFSSHPSLSEASEGLQHSVNEDAKVTSETPAVQPSSPSVPKLDRERSLNLTYGIASEDKIEAINRLLYASYHPDEPITNHLGLYKGPGSIPDADRRVRSSIKRNLSLFVYDSNGVEIGVCVNNGYYRHDFLGLLDDCDVVDPAYKVYLAVHKELRSSNTHLFDQIKTDKLFCISMVGVDPAYRSKGVATDLIRRSVLLAGTMGFTGLMTEATGAFSQKAFRRLGMVKTSSIVYRDFEYEGRKPFAEMNPVHPELAMMKKKFFQSCLKHIL